jgi:tRNA(Ile)-lysidine synthetase-like protein
MNIELKFRQNILSGTMVKQDSTVVLAVSGGVDSMVMLDLFNRFKESTELDIVVAHVNHGLRGAASDNDETLVKDAAERYGVPFESTRWNFDGKGNLQDEARRFRLNFFTEVAKRYSASAIVTGHNQDDQVETVLLHMLRGSGLNGLCGIPWRTDLERGVSLVRPLLNISRVEIEDYAKRQGLNFAEDASNSSDKYTRNELRNKFLPQMETLNPNLKNNIAAMTDRLKEDEEALNSIAQEFCEAQFKKTETRVSFNRDAFLSCLPAVRRRVLIAAYEKVNGSRSNLNSDQLARMDEIAKSSTKSGSYCLPCDFKFERNENLIYIG